MAKVIQPTYTKTEKQRRDRALERIGKIMYRIVTSKEFEEQYGKMGKVGKSTDKWEKYGGTYGKNRTEK